MTLKQKRKKKDILESKKSVNKANLTILFPIFITWLKYFIISQATDCWVYNHCCFNNLLCFVLFCFLAGNFSWNKYFTFYFLIFYSVLNIYLYVCGCVYILVFFLNYLTVANIVPFIPKNFIVYSKNRTFSYIITHNYQIQEVLC